MKQTVEDDKVKDKISADEVKTICDACDEAIKWLDNNQTAEKVNIMFDSISDVLILIFRTNSNTKRRNWKRSAHQSSPRCTKVLVVVCQAVCQICLVPLVVTLLVLPLEDQPLKKSINASSTVCMQGDNQPTQYNACFTAIVTVK